MKYRTFFAGTIPVSAVGLGTWQLGQASGWRPLSETDAIALVEASLDQGVNFFDTAPNYGHGTSELRLGKALKGQDRSRLVINTKFGHTDTGAVQFGAEHLRRSLEGSLQRLQTDYVDSLILHNPPSAYLDGRQTDHYEVLERLQEEGKIKAYGASLDTYADMQRLMDTTPAQVIEVFFNLLHQDTAQGFAQAQAQGIGLIVKIPLDSGWLTGKYHAGSTFAGVRSRWSRQDIETRAYLVDQVKAMIGGEAPLAQQAIAFCLAYEAVSTVIPGSVDIEQLTQNVQSAARPFPLEQLARLEQFYQTEIRPRHLPW